MMRQYKRLKEQCKDAILFFRLGDFYEMFEQDAKEASSILNLTFTKRHGVPMCGVPYHAASSYISRLLRTGRKVAICEQVSEPPRGKGITEREIVEIITPGTVVDENFLDQSENNYILAIGRTKDFLSFAWVDSSTGTFKIAAVPFSLRSSKLREYLYRLDPRELIIQESLLEEDNRVSEIIIQKDNLLINRYPDWSFDQELSIQRCRRQFNVLNLKGFGIEDDDPALYSVSVLLEYLEESAKSVLPHIRRIIKEQENSFLQLDEATQKNLELVKNLNDGRKKYTLIDVLDHTKTALGARKIKQWIFQPLRDKKKIQKRNGRIDDLYRNQLVLNSIRETLSEILDLERLSARAALDKAHAKDLLGIKITLQNIITLNEILLDSKIFSADQEEYSFSPEPIKELIELLDSSIKEDPSILLTEGNLIKKGYSEELDGYKELESNSKKILKEYLENEKKKCSISNLKIRYNKIIGYYLEVTKSNLALVPSHFIRRQTLVGSERFTTDRLVELETELNSVSEKIIVTEKDLFLKIRKRVKENIPLLLDLAEYTASIDCIQSLAHVATVRGYVKPVILDNNEIIITDGRHPVVEAYLPPGEFVPNNLTLGGSSKSFILLTGPNMAGKSTYLRQNALIVLMAQMGSFVPAADAKIGIVDKIFCRVGASDNLARGESTFLVEMNETANILHTATAKSLIIMDEVGRGTSTHDGLSIAWAVSEYILKKMKSKTLFATHYHELTLLEHKNLKNLSMDVREREGKIIFLKQVKEGPAGRSYGIHVARLAGIPEDVLNRAEKLLSQLEEMETKEFHEPLENNQHDLFSASDLLLQEIRSLDVNNLTPVQALNHINRWQNELKKY